MPPKRLRSKKSATSPNPQSSKHGRVNPGEPMATSPGKSPPSTPERESFQSTRSQASPTLSDTNMSPPTTSPAIDLTRPALTQPSVDTNLDDSPAKRLSFDTLLDLGAPKGPKPRSIVPTSVSPQPSRPATTVTFDSPAPANPPRALSATSRFDVRLHVEPSPKNTFPEVLRNAKDFFAALRDADSNLKLHPWDPKCSAPVLTSIDSLKSYPQFIQLQA